MDDSPQPFALPGRFIACPVRTSRLLFTLLVAFLENGGIDIPGARPAAIRNVAGNIHELASLLA